MTLCTQKEFLIESIKWIFGGSAVTFGLGNFHRGGEVKCCYVLILNYFRGRLVVPLLHPRGVYSWGVCTCSINFHQTFIIVFSNSQLEVLQQ